MDYIIEKTIPEYIPQIAAIEEEEFSFPMDMEMLHRLLDDDSVIFLSAVQDGTVLGYASLKYVDDEGYFNNIAVHRSFRGLGIGDRLLKELLSESGSCNISTISLEVRQMNVNAIRLYEKNGFETAGIIKNYYTKPKDNAIIMRTSLNIG